MSACGPSQTAQRVAAHRLEFDRREAVFGRPTDDERLARDVAGEVEIRHEEMHRYLRARTAFIDWCVLDAISNAIDQIVILGAGYDGRSLRYACDGVGFFEVDLATTQRDKLARLARLGIDMSGVTYVQADFTSDNVGALLVASGLRSRTSLFVLEGVVAYLDDATLCTLLESVASVAVPGSVLAVSIGISREEADHDAVERTAAFRATVASYGEPVRSTLSPSGARELLAATGWTVAAADPRDEGPLDADTREHLGLVVARRR